MTQTIEPTAAAGTKPQARVDDWFARFQQALDAQDVDAAAELFAPESFWRDLVAFTWNITTVEGQEGVADLPGATLATARPTGFRTTEPPTEEGGVITAWFEFETAVGRESEARGSTTPPTCSSWAGDRAG